MTLADLDQEPEITRKDDRLIVPESVTGPGRPDGSEGGTPPTAYFVLYRNGGEKDGQWHMVSEILVAHDLDELMSRVLDRYPGVTQASKIRFVPADSGTAYNTSWRLES